jgi:Spy/CpxP family protein refolding chaperone
VKHDLTSRRSVAVRSRTLAFAALCLGLLLALAAPLSAQVPGGGHGEGGPRRGFGGMRDGGFGPPIRQPLPQYNRGLQLGLGGRWWNDHKTVKKLTLRPDQQQRMDTIFEANKPVLINLYTNLQREEAHLASLPPGDLQDETKVFAAIDRVAQARTDLEKENVHMLLQIRAQLDPTQLAALDKEIATTTQQ